MLLTNVTLGEWTLPARVYDAVVVGTGCAGFNAADRLHHYGRTDIAIITDHRNGGTSRNTGSDYEYATECLFLSTAISIGTIPLVTYIGLNLLK